MPLASLAAPMPENTPLPDDALPVTGLPAETVAAPAPSADDAAALAAASPVPPLEASADDSAVPPVAAAAGAPTPPAMSPAACGDALRRLFPALFDGPVRPLKLRIQADIQARAPGLFSKTVLSAFLRRYTGSTSYLIALTRAPQRVDLDGAPAGELADEHRQAAADELNRRRALANERRAAEDAQRQQRAQLLRDFERTTLTPANFCALKGLTPEALEQQLAQARAEAAEPRREDPRRHHDGPRRGDGRNDGRNEGRGRPPGGPGGPRREPRGGR